MWSFVYVHCTHVKCDSVEFILKALLFFSLALFALLILVCKGKKGPGSPGIFKKRPRTFGLLWSRDHGTKEPSRSLGPVLSRPGNFPGPSRDLPGWDSPAGKPNAHHHTHS